MMKHRQIFRLKVDKIDQECCFELFWGQGQQIKVSVTYPIALTQNYQAWQRAYLRYYQTSIRGRLTDQGNLTPLNPHAQLVQSETKLLTEFKNWLGSEKLLDIRKTIATTIRQWVTQDSIHQIDLFLTCSPIELERLPWEAWELETEIAAPVSIHLTRTPVNLRSGYATSRNQYRRGGARILAIFGDQTGLDFQNDLKALRSLSSLAEIKIIAWHEQCSITQLKTEICEAISDSKGWDILFFAGHSREADTMGGELAIAPRTTISIRELEPYLKTAQAKGLQFALFNSCSGLSIANALLDLGLNQVAIMREPIQNQVAQVFLVKFLQVLAQQKEVCAALRETCQFLRDRKNLEYPSAYLLPSLFGHPEAKFYKIEPMGWKARFKQWLPNREAAIAVCSISLLSLLPPLQESLQNQRTLIQAIYRELTNQIPQQSIPPVLLVSINQTSLNAAKITQPLPLDRQYLAKIINQLSILNAQVIGIDYLLDRPQGQNDQILSQSLQNAINQQGTSFVFAATLEGEQEIGIIPEIASLNWSSQGSITTSPNYVAVPNDCSQICPFGYLIAVNQALSTSGIVWPKLSNQSDYKTQLLNFLAQTKTDTPQLNSLRRVSIHPITQISEYFRQRWLQPITDFSLKPEIVYQTISAQEILDQKKPIKGQVVLIASGGYAEAGIDGAKDYFDPPLAIAFWHPWTSKFTGGEAHAYMIHHWLTQHLVIPIPDLWLILVAALLGKAIRLQSSSATPSRRLIIILLSVNALYVLVSLQAYITLKILFPWFFPSVIFWLYLLTSLKKSSYEK